MARHDVHPLPGNGEGYAVDVQADLFAHLTTRTVVPLLPEDAPKSRRPSPGPGFGDARKGKPG